MSDIIKFDTEQLAQSYVAPIKIETFNLVDSNHPILRTKILEFDFDNPPVDPNKFASSLTETCKVHNGFGLSANQCGFSYRVFVMGSAEEYVAFFNPKIIGQSEEESLITEGCLSFPMLAIKISRPNLIDVVYQDYNGQKHNTTLSGISAHVFQHELDHLNGIVYTERAKPMALKSGLKKQAKLDKLMNRYHNANAKISNVLNK
jgi:peptide deformylase